MEFQWLNESEMTERDGVISILAPEHTDFFCNSGAEAEEGDAVPDSLWRVKVSHDFKQTYDSCSIMVFKDLTHWAKACFELTDFGTRAMVSVVTKGVSDDANGPNVDADAVWLQMCRKGDAFAFHYALDGEHFYMMRFFTLDAGKVAKVGLLAQAPTGEGVDRTPHGGQHPHGGVISVLGNRDTAAYCEDGVPRGSFPCGTPSRCYSREVSVILRGYHELFTMA